MQTVETRPATPAIKHHSHAETALVGVYEISKLLASANRLENTLAGVLNLMSSFLDMRHGLIALLDAAGEPEIVVGSGWTETNAKQFFDRLPERAIGQIVATKMPLVVPDVKASPLFADTDLSDWGPDDGAPFSLIGVPIKDGDKVTGTLTIDRVHDRRSPIRFDEDVRFLTMTANLVGQTLRLHQMIARDRERLMAEQRRLEKELSMVTEPTARAEGIVGDSPALRAVLDKVRIVAKSNSTVLLRGESGTGKELFATTIHKLSPRAKGPFIKLNCAALPESVLESELFGHEKGAFTGAIAQRKGRFELADKGTLFLDEIGEISPSFQAKLLRVLQEGEFDRIGSSKTIKVDVRLVCATNKNLEDAVAKGEFRADLYYRISVVPIFLPSLRDRQEDVPLLAREFLQRFNREHGAGLDLSDTALSVLSGCYFPGNIRELENCIRRTATFAHGSLIEADDFACRSDNCLSSVLWKSITDRPVTHRPGFIPLPVVKLTTPRPQSALPPAADSDLSDDDPPGERDRLVDAMETAGWVQAKAARILGLTPRQMGYALRKYDIEIKKF